jgi:2-isopropylmalate synthase
LSRESDLIYDWNLIDEAASAKPSQTIELNDETLRDGLQSPSVLSPPIEKKVELLHLMAALSIQSVNIGLPGAGPHVQEHVTRLAREIVDQKLDLTPNCAARTLEADIEPIAAISQDVGIPIEAATFIGSSPIRQYVEKWELERLVKHTADAVSYTVAQGLPNMYVTEDTIRARPETIRTLYTTAIECGSRRVVLTDTVGHATPHGVTALVSFMKEVVADTGEDVKIDWHGHRDRGLGMPNALAAIEEGVDRIHGTALGIGERVGNTEMDLLLVNLHLLGVHDHELTSLPEYCQLAADMCGLEIPHAYPVVGRDAFRTGTGVHASAIIKAIEMGDEWLVDWVYSGVPASLVGCEQTIEISPVSGMSNVRFWLTSHGYDGSDEDLAKVVFALAKQSDHTLTVDEIEAVIGAAE